MRIYEDEDEDLQHQLDNMEASNMADMKKRTMTKSSAWSGTLREIRKEQLAADKENDFGALGEPSGTARFNTLTLSLPSSSV